jgi:hypothetical protein
MLNVAIFIGCRHRNPHSWTQTCNVVSGMTSSRVRPLNACFAKENKMTENSIEGVRERIDRADAAVARVRGRIDADVDPPSGELGTLEHDEWALDEALEETFPASDPPTPPRPGSTMAQRYAVRAIADGFRLRRLRAIRWAVIAASVFCAVLWLRQRRD